VKGFFNKLLAIDLGVNKSVVEDLPDEVLKKTLGGKGLAAQILYDRNPPQVDPMSPENLLILAWGPSTDTRVWGGCRHGIFTKSPQTGGFAESYSGGKAAEFMSRTGFDGTVIKGAAHEPVWIEISENGAEIHSASDLWGLDTYETEDRLKAWVKDSRDGAECGVVCIGPAGENMAVMAVVENDYWRSAGRTGTGAVMGSKKIKAIVFHGDAKRTAADDKLLSEFSKEYAKRSKDDAGVAAYKSKGTPMMVDIMNGVGSFPTRYWHKGQADHKDRINADALHTRLDVTPNACRKCFIACGRLATVKEGRHQGLKIEGPEYETIYSFGGLCEVRDIEEIAYLNDICDRLGLDTMSAGNLAGLTIEAVKNGKADYDIDYGQVDRIAALIEDIAFRRGIGDLLAKGIKAAAREWGMEDQAIHVKGLEPAGYDPRVLKGMGLAYGSSPRGACHLRATFYKPELAGMIPPDQVEGKAEMFAEWEDRLIIFDTLVLCRFYRDLYQWENLGTMIKSLTGLELGVEDMRGIAGYISNLTRRFNLREGLKPEDDRLPKRFFTEPLPETGNITTVEQQEAMLADYYRIRGWDEEGRPAG
jgi:aldehyde:ferredoxin oxidoreductase